MSETTDWKRVPLTKLTEFGATTADVSALRVGLLRTSGRHPVFTMGGLADFKARHELTDVIGMSAEGAERIEDAELGFWGWWNREHNNGTATTTRR